MKTIILCLGILCILSGICSFILNRSIIISHRHTRYTEASLRRFIWMAASLRMLIGLCLLIYVFFALTAYAIFINWFCGVVIWISAAAYITLHFVILTKKTEG